MFPHNDYINRRENDYLLWPYNEQWDELELKSQNRRIVDSAVLWMLKLLPGRLDGPNLKSQLQINTTDTISEEYGIIGIKEDWLNSPFYNASRT